MTEPSVPESRDAPAHLAAMLLQQQPISDLLHKILAVTVTTLRTVSAASVTLAVSEPPGYRTVCASDASARSLDEVQYHEGGGPCVAAARGSGGIARSLPDPEWESFSASAVATGYRSVRSLPLVLEGGTAGSLNLYSSAAGPWDETTIGAVRLIGEQTREVMVSATELSRAEHVNATLRQALETRTVIGQAQGVLMARQGIDAEEAFDVLRRASHRTNRKLRDIATDIVAGLAGGQPGSC